MTVSPLPRIGIVLPDLAGGGAERVVLTLAGALLERGYPVDLILQSLRGSYRRPIPDGIRIYYRRRKRTTDPDLLAYCRERRIEMRPLAINLMDTCSAWLFLQRLRIGCPLNLGRIRKASAIARYLREAPPQLLFAHLPVANCAAILGAEVARACIPVMASVHSNVDMNDGYKGPNMAVARSTSPRADAVVAVSQGVARTVIDTLGVDARKTHVIYNPAVTPDIDELAQLQPDHPWFSEGGPPVILGAGRLVPEKDFPTLIDAFRRIRASRPCRLVILGEGPLRPELEARIAGLGLDNWVSLPGWVENPFAFMARAALFVLSSRHEGFGNVLVEALACGCPAVSTDCPDGPSEILEDPTLLAPVGDPEALAQVMLRTLDRPVDKATLRASAARFSVEGAIDGYETLIADVLSERSQSKRGFRRLTPGMAV